MYPYEIDKENPPCLTCVYRDKEYKECRLCKLSVDECCNCEIDHCSSCNDSYSNWVDKRDQNCLGCIFIDCMTCSLFKDNNDCCFEDDSICPCHVCDNYELYQV